MSNRRNFIKGGLLGAVGTAIFPKLIAAKAEKTNPNSEGGHPMVISTWKHGMPANVAAMEVLQAGGKAIDAVETGVKIPEADPESMSVGLGGLPDREGKVTLDACIMDETGNCGSVSFLQHIKHPISVARKVMDETPHVMLSGEGALQFALDKGFPKEDLLTEKAKKRWREWLKESEYKPIINVENHDTIGLLALDKKGYIERSSKARGIHVTPKAAAGLYQHEAAMLPLVGEVAAGVPILAEENIESYVPVPTEMANTGAYCLRVRGDSMIEDGILEGDTIIVDQSRRPRKGEIVVALVDGEATVKHFIPNGDEVILHHNVFRRFRDIRGQEKNSRSFYEEDKYFVQPNQIFAYKRNKKWLACSGFNFIQPIKETEMFSINVEKEGIGILRFKDPALDFLNTDDLVGFRPGAEYEFVINGKKMYRVPTNQITIKYEYKGNEEEYNPSWAQSG